MSTTHVVNDNRIIRCELTEFKDLAQRNQGQIINRFDLEEGEEFWDFMDKVHAALQILGQQNDRRYWLIGLFDDHIIVEDNNTGKLYKLDMSRNEDGSVALANMTEVKIQYVPVTEAATRSADQGEGEGNESAPEDLSMVVQIPPVEEKMSWTETIAGSGL